MRSQKLQPSKQREIKRIKMSAFCSLWPLYFAVYRPAESTGLPILEISKKVCIKVSASLGFWKGLNIKLLLRMRYVVRDRCKVGSMRGLVAFLDDANRMIIMMIPNDSRGVREEPLTGWVCNEDKKCEKT